MADKKKDPTPPPLLLMPASEGLTLNPSPGNNLLMPIPHTDSSLFGPEEEGEVDSFVGQAPSQQGPISYFQSPSPSDLFANVRQPDPRATSPRHSPAPSGTPQSQRSISPPGGAPYGQALPASAVAPPSVTPASMAAVPIGLPMSPPGGGLGMMTPPSSVAAAPNQFRMKGGPRRAFATDEMHFGGNAPGGMLPPVGGPPPMCSPPPPLTGAPPHATLSENLFQDAPPQPMAHPPTSVTSGSATSPSFGSPVMSPSSGGVSLGAFTPLVHHWFYCKNVSLRQIWFPFSIADSIRLEEVFREGHAPEALVSVEGGRYDVNLTTRIRHAVFWEEDGSPVRRCSWFYKSDGDNRFIPYDESFAIRLEEEYKTALATNTWHKKIEMEGETIIMHNANVIVHFRTQPDEWGTVQGDAARPRVVKRGIDEFPDIEDGELAQIDHVVFVVHGIGSTCDLRFRNIVECVDDFRIISNQIMGTHFKSHQAEGRIGRVEYLPVRWHAALHGDATGIDRRLKAITLNSIGKLRHFTNDTLLDILFYASPTYSQQIVQTVGDECNRLYQLFLSRNPHFRGSISVAGHSLGSLILFDLLSNQGHEQQVLNGDGNPSETEPEAETTLSWDNTMSQEDCNEPSPAEDEVKEEVSLSALLNKLSLGEFVQAFEKEQVDMESLRMLDDSDLKDMGLPMGPRKKLQGYLKLQKNKQKRRKEEAERMARLEAERVVREQALRAAEQKAQQQLAKTASNPLLRKASNTSVNYVIASMGTGLPLVKYPLLDFNPVNFFALGSPIAMFQTVRGVEMLGEDFRLPTCPGFFNVFHPFDPVAYRLEPLICGMFPPKPFLMPHHKGRKRLHLELKESLSRMGNDLRQRIVDSVKITWKTINDFALAHRAAPNELTDQDVDSAISQIAKEHDPDDTASVTSSVQDDDLLVGSLNGGRRIDYVLQEKPIESFNDYLFALGSHACYWESEDTVLLILKEIYALLGIAPTQPGQPDRVAAFSSPPRGGFVSPTSPASAGSPPGAPGSLYGAFPGPGAGPGPSAFPGLAESSDGALPLQMGLPPMDISPPPMGSGLPVGRHPPPPPMSGFTPSGGPPPMTGFLRK